jgi:hypothetical protein
VPKPLGYLHVVLASAQVQGGERVPQVVVMPTSA